MEILESFYFIRRYQIRNLSAMTFEAGLEIQVHLSEAGVHFYFNLHAPDY
jgi:hypothetical protein